MTMGVVGRSRVKTEQVLDQGDLGARLEELLDEADVLLHDLPANTEAALGLNEAGRRWPQLVVGACPSFPPGTGEAEGPGSEILVQAWLGLLDEQESCSGEPLLQLQPICSLSAAYLLAAGVLAHLVGLKSTGRGARVETSLLQGGLLATCLYWQRVPAPPPKMDLHTLRKFNSSNSLAIFRCGDGEWLQAMGRVSSSKAVHDALVEAGLPLPADDSVAPENRQDWELVFATATRQEWLERLWAEDLPCMPVLRRGELLLTDQAQLNGAVVDVAGEGGHLTKQAGQPFQITAVSEDGLAPWSLAGRQTSSASGPLAGLRVVDFGMFVAGPFSAQGLADLGAEVIKVEPLTGERGRWISQYLACQRGKRSLALDMKHPDAAEVISRLLAWADVVVHNFRDRAARSLGIDFDSAKMANSQVVFGSVSGFGTKGPWASLPGYDPTAQALSGWEIGSVAPGSKPAYSRHSIMDTHTGCALLLGVLTALVAKTKTGSGAAVHASLLGTAALSDCSTVVDAAGNITAELPISSDQSGLGWNYRIYKTSDGYIAVSAVSAGSRQALLEAGAVEDPTQLADVFCELETSVVADRLRRHGVECEVVRRDNEDAFFTSQFAQGSPLVRKTTSRLYGSIEHAGAYWSSSVGLPAHSTVSDIGEDSVEILGRLGFGEPQIQMLIAAGAVGA
jgi:crotonobetainyl-CoA:carnitine CoA-transferase CaiB-like acyl-CoA transferase